jgi:RNA polymerase I-specific transcription initiation factor RRN11
MNEKRSFIFAWPGSKNPSSTRKIHLRQLYDTLQLSILRNDITEARRAWDILSRCKEVPTMEMWTTAVHLLGDDLSQEGTNERQLEFLRTTMFQYPTAVSRASFV